MGTETRQQSSSGGISRRTFVEVAMGALTAVPAALGASFIDPTPAYADTVTGEKDGGDATKAGALSVIAAKPYEASFIVADMSNGGKTRVAGARVRVTSRENKKSVEKITDERGLVQLDISELSDNPFNRERYKLTRYEFDGSISVSCPGYRDFESALVHLEGGMLFEVPTRQVTDGLPYPASVSLADWDILYTKNEFLLTPENGDKCNVGVTVKNLAAGEAVVSLAASKDGAAIAQTKVTPKDGVATASFSQTFLKKGSNEALSGDKNYLRVEQGGKTYYTELSVQLSGGKLENAVDKSNVKLDPINLDTATKGLGLTWPKSIPVIGGSRIAVWTPDWIVNVDLNPFGFLRVTIPIVRGSKEINTKTKKWSKGFFQPRKSIAAQFDKLLDNMAALSDKSGNALGANGNIQKIDTFGSVATTLNAQLIFGAQWSEEKGTVQYSGGAQFFATLSASYTLNYMLGPIPALVIFAFDASADATGTLGGYMVRENKNEKLADVAGDLSRIKWDPANSSLSFRITPVISVSIGVGIRGVASICAKGSAGLSFYISWSPAARAGKSECHVIFGYILKLDLVVHLFLFTKTWNLLNGTNLNWIDNWDDKTLKGQADEGGLDPERFEGYTLEQLAAELVPITEEMLDAVLEAEMSVDYAEGHDENDPWWNVDPETLPDSPEDWWNEEDDWWYDDDVLTGQAEGLPLVRKVVAFEQLEDVDDTLDDGTPITYHSYSFGVVDAPEAKVPEQQVAEQQAESEARAAEEQQAQDAAQQEAPQQDAAQGELAEPVAEVADDAATEAPEEVGDAEAAGADVAALQAAAAVVATAPVVGEEGLVSMDAEPALQAAAEEGTVADDAILAVQTEEAAVAGEADGATLVEDAPAIAAELDEPAPEAVAEPASEEAPEEAQDEPAPEEVQDESAPQPEEEAEAEEASEQQAEQESETDEGLTSAADGEFGVYNPLIAMADEAPLNPAGLGVAGGLRPSSDTLLTSKVFGDPRAKIISFTTGGESYTYLFRISTMQVRTYKTQMKNWLMPYRRANRTRIVATSLYGPNKGASYPVDIFIDPRNAKDAFDRWNYYDYDFDVVVDQNGDQGSGFIYFTIISGKRSDADKDGKGTITLDGAMSDTVFLFIRMKASDIRRGKATDNKLWFVRTANEALGGNAGDRIHSISNLQCHQQNTSMVVSFLDRSAPQSDRASLVKGESGNVRVDLGLMIVSYSVRNKNNPILIPDRASIDGKIGTLPKDIYEMDVSDQVGGQHTIMLRGGQTALFILMNVNYPEGRLSNLQRCKDVYTFDKNEPMKTMLPRLVAWPKHNSYLCTHDGKLQSAKWVDGSLTFTPVGPDKFGVAAFGVSSKGTFVFWPQSRDGDQIKDYDDEGKPKTAGEKVYHIMACRMRTKDGKDSFGEPFIMADLGHDADQLSVISVSGTALDLLVTELTSNGDTSYSANLYRTRIPHTKCITVLGAEAPNRRVAPGGEAFFDLTLRNNGNTYLSGCTIDLCVGGQAVKSAELTFSKDTLRESAYNQSDANGVLQDVEADYSLAPGKHQVHRVSMPIPADWTGEKQVAFKARDFKLVGGDLYSQADEDEGEIYSYEGEPVMVNMDGLVMYEDDVEWAEYYNDAPVEVYEGYPEDTEKPADGSGGSKQSGTKQGTTKGGDTKSRSTLPQTGDSNTGIVSAGLAAAGAAILAYERRRAENEGRQS